MENNDSFTVRGSLSLGIFKTIYLFLLNHNFPKSAETFKTECELYNGNLDNVPSKSLFLKKCRCSKNQANQTEYKDNGKHKNEWLTSTCEGGLFQVKDDETHIFYVCDHCQQNIEKSIRKQENKQVEVKEKTFTEPSPKSEFVKLKSKFSQLQGEHQKLIAVTSELTTALQMNIIGQTKNIYSVLEHCKSLYPSLFLPASPQIPIFENDQIGEKYQGSFLDNVKYDSFLGSGETCSKEDKRKEEGQSHETSNSPKINNDMEQLNLEHLSPRSPTRTPLTPETVRQILETVFERIFQMEKYSENDSKSPHLKKDEVEKIVNDVLHDISKSPLNAQGAGEGEIATIGSTGEFVVMRNSENFFDVDFKKIKRDLLHTDNERKIRILQALRWRITKNDCPVREKVMESYVNNDVLDLFSATSIPEKILTGYNNDHYVQESTCRLINTLASLRQGRDYLTVDEKLLKRVLIKKVKDIKSVSSAVIRNMLVASVQKLSIRKQCRAQMVHEGLFEILVDYLDEFYEKLSRYCLEYCSALLMNLCLVDEAKERSTKNPKKVIDLIRKFLEGENECCLPYINGVMFSLLEKEEMVTEAKSQHLDKLLIRLIRITSNENIKKQLDFIVQSRLFGKGDANISDGEDEIREEVDLLEIELDQDDFITQLPSGEKFLEEYKTDKLPNAASFSTIKRDPPNSAKSYSEENKQFYHKPSTERGIFEGTKARRSGYTTCSQSLIRNYVKNKKHNQIYGRFPATPLCYMENCRRLQEGSNASCSCTKCVPGQNRYSCGCYDAIRREVDENDEQNLGNHASQMDFGKIENKTRW